MKPGFEWYLPTWYGDIRLRVVDDGHTRVEVTALTRGELAAIRALRQRSLKGGILRRPWATEKVWESMPDEAFAVGSGARHRVVLRAPLRAVESFLTQRLRGQSETVTVTITDRGNLHEIKALDPAEEETNVLPFRRPHLAEPGEEPEAATTVRKPVVGCPAPDFVQAHERATEVLRRFLTPAQIRDYERHQRFASEGADTGHRYVITSRHARSELGTTSRTLYDADERRPYCVHDWGVPAPEEMLTMHLMVSLPGWESYVRGLSGDRDDDLSAKIDRIGSRPKLLPPPPHYYYDMNGCLRRFRAGDLYVEEDGEEPKPVVVNHGKGTN